MLRPVAVALTVLALSLPAAATTVLDVPLERMAHDAPLVVEGVVSGKRVERSKDRGQIVTRTRIKISKTLKGESRTELLVWQAGGTVEGVTSAIPGDATFTDGEQVVLFLEPHPQDPGAFVLLAMNAAKFVVEQSPAGPIVRRDLSKLSFARAGSDGVIRHAEPLAPATLTLDALRRTVERAR